MHARRAILTIIAIRQFRRSNILSKVPKEVIKTIAEFLWSTRFEKCWAFDDLESLKIVSHLDNEVCVSYEKSKINMEELINLVKKNNVKIIDISTDDGDLEDVFLRLIKN